MQSLENQVRYRFQYYRKLLQYIRKVKRFHPNLEFEEPFIRFITEASDGHPRNSEILDIMKRWEAWSLRSGFRTQEK